MPHDPKSDHGYSPANSDRSTPKTPAGQEAPRFVIRKSIDVLWFRGTGRWDVWKHCPECSEIYRRPVWKFHVSQPTFTAAIEYVSKEQTDA